MELAVSNGVCDAAAADGAHGGSLDDYDEHAEHAELVVHARLFGSRGRDGGDAGWTREGTREEGGPDSAVGLS